MLWNGKKQEVDTTTINITNGKADGITSAVFCVPSGTVKAECYKAQSIAYDEDGNIAVEATVYPLNDSGASLITENWDDTLAWDVEGTLQTL